MFRNVFLLSLCFASGVAVAADQGEKFFNCKPTTVFYQNQEVSFKQDLKPGLAAVYLLHNTSHETLILDHKKANVGAGAGWASEIAPNHWSAMMISDKQFNLQCSVVGKNGFEKRDCAVLKVCQPKNMAIIQAEGNYWTEEDKSLTDLKKNLEGKHID